MPLVGQVVDDAPRSSGVIDMNAGQRGVLRGSDDGARHVDLRHEGPPRVIAGRVDQDDTVDTMLSPPLSMDLTLLLRRAHQLQHQGDSSRSENLLHPRDEVQEEPFPGETAIVTGDDETDSTGSIDRQRLRGDVRTPSHVLGHSLDTSSGSLRNSRLVIEGKGHRARRHTGDSGDVLDRRPAHEATVPSGSMNALMGAGHKASSPGSTWPSPAQHHPRAKPENG